MSLKSAPVNLQIGRLVGYHAAIARSNRLSFALAAVQQQQWTVNSYEHSVRFAGDTVSIQRDQTRVLREAGRAHRGHPNKHALHLLAGVSLVQTRKCAGNLADFMSIANGNDRLSQVVRQGWRDLPRRCKEPSPCFSTPRCNTEVLAGRAVTAAAKSGLLIRTKLGMATELHGDQVLDMQHRTRQHDHALNPLVALAAC